MAVSFTASGASIRSPLATCVAARSVRGRRGSAANAALISATVGRAASSRCGPYTVTYGLVCPHRSSKRASTNSVVMWSTMNVVSVWLASAVSSGAPVRNALA